MGRPKKRKPPPGAMTPAQRIERAEAVGQQLVLGDGGLVRTQHPPLTNNIERVVYLARLLTSGLYQQGTTNQELQEDWRLSSNAVSGLLSDARKQIALRGDASYVKDVVHDRLASWLDEPEAKDRVPAAKLWLQSVGALKSEVHVAVRPEEQLTDEEVWRKAIDQLMADEQPRALMRRALADWDAQHTMGPAEVLSCTPTDHAPEAAAEWAEIERIAQEEEKHE